MIVARLQPPPRSPVLRPLTKLVALAAALGAIILPAATASADVVVLDIYCFNANPCPAGGQTFFTPQGALDQAATDPGPGKVLIGPPPPGSVYVGPLTYDDHDIANNDVTVEGQGSP